MSYKSRLAIEQHRRLAEAIGSGDLSKRHLTKLGFDVGGSTNNIEKRRVVNPVDPRELRRLARKVLGE